MYFPLVSSSGHTAINVADPAGVLINYSVDGPDSGATTKHTGSVNEQHRNATVEDGKGHDPKLDELLENYSRDNIEWIRGTLIGQGSFGKVFLALHAITGELMAVRQTNIPSSANNDTDKRKKSTLAALKSDIDLLRTLSHPHIVQYYGSNTKENKLNIFLGYVPGGSVAAMLNTYGELKKPLVRKFMRQILDVLFCLHSRNIIHGDIKGANVLVNDRGNVKVSKVPCSGCHLRLSRKFYRLVRLISGPLAALLSRCLPENIPFQTVTSYKPSGQACSSRKREQGDENLFGTNL